MVVHCKMQHKISQVIRVTDNLSCELSLLDFVRCVEHRPYCSEVQSKAFILFRFGHLGNVRDHIDLGIELLVIEPSATDVRFLCLEVH